MMHDDAIPASPNHLQQLLVLVLNSPCHSCSILKGQRLPVTWRAQIHRVHWMPLPVPPRHYAMPRMAVVNGYQATEVEEERTSISELFSHHFFWRWKRVERKKKAAGDCMPSISSLRCCKGILCTGLRGQSLAELHWTLLVKNSLFKLGTSSTQPSWLLPKGRHHHSAMSWVVEAALLQI